MGSNGTSLCATQHVLRCVCSTFVSMFKMRVSFIDGGREGWGAEWGQGVILVVFLSGRGCGAWVGGIFNKKQTSLWKPALRRHVDNLCQDGEDCQSWGSSIVNHTMSTCRSVLEDVLIGMIQNIQLRTNWDPSPLFALLTLLISGSLQEAGELASPWNHSNFTEKVNYSESILEDDGIIWCTPGRLKTLVGEEEAQLSMEQHWYHGPKKCCNHSTYL